MSMQAEQCTRTGVRESWRLYSSVNNNAREFRGEQRTELRAVLCANHAFTPKQLLLTLLPPDPRD